MDQPPKITAKNRPPYGFSNRIFIDENFILTFVKKTDIDIAYKKMVVMLHLNVNRCTCTIVCDAAESCLRPTETIECSRSYIFLDKLQY